MDPELVEALKTIAARPPVEKVHKSQTMQIIGSLGALQLTIAMLFFLALSAHVDKTAHDKAIGVISTQAQQNVEEDRRLTALEEFRSNHTDGHN